jgi:hypothetical protein
MSATEEGINVMLMNKLRELTFVVVLHWLQIISERIYILSPGREEGVSMVDSRRIIIFVACHFDE